VAAALQKDRYGQSSDATAPDWAVMTAGAWGASSWKSAAREYRGARKRSGGKPPQPPDPQLLALLDPAISLEQAQRRFLERRRGGAAASIVEALVYSLRRNHDPLAERCGAPISRTQHGSPADIYCYRCTCIAPSSFSAR
jgi:hypothetical protein